MGQGIQACLVVNFHGESVETTYLTLKNGLCGFFDISVSKSHYDLGHTDSQDKFVPIHKPSVGLTNFSVLQPVYQLTALKLNHPKLAVLELHLNDPRSTEIRQH